MAKDRHSPPKSGDECGLARRYATYLFIIKEITMPTILLILGWRLFFYANEGNEPIHVHCQKAEKECKYWLDRESFDINEAYSYNMSSRDKREVRKIIFDHFEHIEHEWDNFQANR